MFRFLIPISRRKMKKVVRKFFWETLEILLADVNPTLCKFSEETITVKTRKSQFLTINKSTVQKLLEAPKKLSLSPRRLLNQNKIETGKPSFHYCWTEMPSISFWDIFLSKVVQPLTSSRFWCFQINVEQSFLQNMGQTWVYLRLIFTEKLSWI